MTEHELLIEANFYFVPTSAYRCYFCKAVFEIGGEAQRHIIANHKTQLKLSYARRLSKVTNQHQGEKGQGE